MEQKTKDDEWYWELLEEQHNHDVRISGAEERDNGNELLRSEEQADN